jgi:DNA invertase Pin-like site-specific DNA recombinase
MRCALYARVSTLDQQPENQLRELRRYVEARGWTAVEYVDHGVSGSKDSRPALDKLVKDARRRKFDVVVTWKLDRLGRNLKHLITLLDDLQALGGAFVSLGEGIDATTPAGKLQMHILGAIAEFERGRIVERVRAGVRPRRRENAWADGHTRLHRSDSKPSIISRCARRRRRSASAARWCIGGGCHVNPRKWDRNSPRNPQRFRRSPRERRCHANTCFGDGESSYRLFDFAGGDKKSTQSRSLMLR